VSPLTPRDSVPTLYLTRNPLRPPAQEEETHDMDTNLIALASGALGAGVAFAGCRLRRPARHATACADRGITAALHASRLARPAAASDRALAATAGGADTALAAGAALADGLLARTGLARAATAVQSRVESLARTPAASQDRTTAGV
jgi:hypothetical protein